ncbi:MAG TPA: iron-containing alcohol dehydrogenase [Candidatus Acutalibacter pullistercoris]|uniref:Iron-containing alcohol dehydrogenase n=1 Tax=Candidatus Acutalibacter pullistercoris TaxID=2838418 RepID=A0A9D1YGA5_9FIRM|nr:iron-containing alcohol dehydrogenase [Candidatus Acutalibacter pullistercoris]
MNDFTYFAPTKVVFGKGAEGQVGKLCKEQGATKVLVHFGGGSAKRSGLLDRVCAALEEEGLPYVTLGGVVPNPRLSLVYEGIELCRREGVDFLLAVGGGSVIDSCKAIGYGLANDFDVWELFDKKRAAAGCAPVGAVLTIAAAGSEMSDSTVITKDEGELKRGYNSNYCRCKFAVLNPELTYTLPEYQTACGVTDIMMHIMERYFVNVETMTVTDTMAEAVIRDVLRYGKAALEDPRDYRARAEIMWAGSLAHNGLLCAGGPNGDWASHQIEMELSGMFGVAHGAGLAAIWGSWARYVLDAKPQRFAQFAYRIFDLPQTGDPTVDGLRGIEAMEDYFRSIRMPVNLRELGVGELTEEQIDELAEKCTYFGRRTIGQFKVLGKEDIKAIYRMAQ